MKVKHLLCVLSIAVAVAGSTAIVGLAQFKPIPNYTGIGAGAQFRNDINSHLSGTTAIAPRLVNLPANQLPVEHDGQLYWCQDCQQVTPCVGGGTGAIAIGAHGQWACAAGSSSGSPVGPAGNDLTGNYPNPSVFTVQNGKTPVNTQNGLNALSTASGNYNMGGNRLQNLGADAASGDALGRGTSTLNALGAPTASYNMNGQTLTGLSNAAAGGQPIAYGQSGAQLSGLNLNNTQLSNLAPASANGQTLAYGQSGGELAAVQTPLVVASATAQHSGTNLTITAPSALTQGTDVEFAVVSYQNAGSITAPSGWTNVRVDCSGGNCQRIDYHVVGAGEPSQYTWTCSSGPNQFNGGIANIRNVNSVSPIDSSAGTNTSAASVNLAALAPAAAGELAMAAISGGAPLYITTPISGMKGTWYLDVPGNWGALVETFPLLNNTGAPLAAQYAATQGNTFTVSEVLIKGLAGLANPVITLGSTGGERNLHGSGTDGSNTIDGYNLNGVYNAVAYGATADASSDSSSAVQNAVNAACAAAANVSGGAPQVSSVYIPTGEYLFLKPVIVQCNPGIRVYGDGMFATTIVQKTNAITQSYGPVFVAPPANAISSLNAGTITSASLKTGAGQSLFWHDSAAPFVLDLNDVMRGIALTPLNNLSALDIRGFLKIGAAPGSSGVFLFGSDGELDGQGCGQGAPGGVWSCNGAAKVYVDANLALHTQFKISGTEVEVHSANSAFTTNTTHEIEAVFDGANVCLFLDGTRVATAAQAGSITQRADEDEVLGGTMEVFPMAGPTATMNTVGPASLDSFEIRKAIPAGRTCANASYTADTAKFTGDGSSVLLLNFDNLLSISGATTTTSPFLIGADRFNGIDMAPGDGPSGAGAWLAVRNTGLALGNGDEFDDLAAAGTIGLLATVNTNGRYHNLSLSGPYTPLYLANSSFNSEQSNLRLNGAGSLAAYIDTNTSGVTKADNLQIDACGWACMIMTGSGGTWSKVYMAPQGNTVWSIVANNFNSSFNVYNFIDPALDVENGGVSGAVFLSGPASLNVFGGGLTSASTTPLITISPQSTGSVAIHGTALSVNSGTPEVVNVESASSGFGSQPMLGTVLFDETEFATSPVQSNPPFNVAWSNQANLVQVIGNNWTINGNTTLSGIPTFSAGLQHVSVAGVATPAAPTISVAGATGGTVYGPYYVVCRDFNGGTTYVSNASNTVANGPATLSASNYIQIAWTGNTSCASWDVLKGNASTSLAINLSGKSASYSDQGQSTSAYTAPLRNNTGDVMAGTMFVSAGTGFAAIPGTVVNGGHFYCPDCDPPASPPVACTSSGTKTGAMVYGIHSQWVCAY